MLDAHSQAILQEFKDNKELFKKAESILSEKLKSYCSELHMLVNSVDTRVKTEKSLTGKLESKGYKYKTLSDITDLVGARVVTFYIDEVDKIAAKVISNFDVDWENSVDKRKIYKYDQFGYKSLHYIVKIPKSMFFDESMPLINEFRFEIQIRTNLQHTWATIYHDTGYKNDVEVPSEYLRRLTRLAGLLEMADEEFMAIRDNLVEYRRGVLQIIKSGKLADVELNGDSYNAFVENGGFDDLIKRIASINHMEIEQVSMRSLLRIFKMLKCETLEDLNNMVKEYSDLAYQLAVLQYEGTDLDIMASNIAPLFLCVVYALKNNATTLDLVYALDIIYTARRSNLSYAKRLYNHGITLGIVKESEENGK